MALRRLFTNFLSSSTLVLLLLILVSTNYHDCSKLIADAAYHNNVNDGKSNAIETSPFICKTAISVCSSRGTMAIPRKLSINPLVVTAVTLAVCGCVTMGLFWMLFAYFWLKSVKYNQNASSIAPHASSCMEMDEDDFNDEYGIMSRRRIRTENLRAVFNAEKLNASK